jgi:hypothetical protein
MMRKATQRIPIDRDRQQATHEWYVLERTDGTLLWASQELLDRLERLGTTPDPAPAGELLAELGLREQVVSVRELGDFQGKTAKLLVIRSGGTPGAACTTVSPDAESATIGSSSSRRQQRSTARGSQGTAERR